MTTNDGGPAFPLENNGRTPYATGMSLRDWFAGQALAGYCATLGEVTSIKYGFLAQDAYAAADAMIAARGAK